MRSFNRRDPIQAARARTRAWRHGPVGPPEIRALDQIVAEAREEGRQVVMLAPEGILQVTASTNGRLRP